MILIWISSVLAVVTLGFFFSAMSRGDFDFAGRYALIAISFIAIGISSYLCYVGY